MKNLLKQPTKQNGLEALDSIPKISGWTPFPFNHGGNYNVAISGKAGSGITYLLRNIALTSDKKVFVIDECDFAKDNFLDKQNEDVVDIINFTEFPDPFSCIDRERLSYNFYQDELFDYLIPLLTSICRPYPCDSKSVLNKSLNLISDVEQGELGMAIKKALTNKENISLQKIADNLSNQSLKEPLNNFIQRNKFFDPKNLRTDKRLTIFRICDISDKSPATIVLLQLIREKLANSREGLERMVIMDDIRYSLSDVSSARFAFKLSRVFRHYFASFITSNQNVEDYYNNPTHRAIFENSDWKLFLQTGSLGSIWDDLKIALNTDLDLQQILPNLSKFNKKQALIHNASEGLCWTEFDLPDFNPKRK